MLFKALHSLYVALILSNQFIEFRLGVASISGIIILLDFSNVCPSSICMALYHFLLQLLMLLLS